MQAIIAAVMLLASGAVCAGVVMEMTEKDLTDPAAAPGVQKLWFDNGQLRVDSVENGRLDTTVIFREGTMYAVDHGERSYTKVDKATMERMASQLGEMRKQMEAQMAGLPPEQRAMIEKMMQGQGMPAAGAKTVQPARTVKATPRTDTVAGRSCRIWEVMRGAEKDQELCVVAPGSIPGGPQLMQAMGDLAAFSRSFMEKLGGGHDPTGDAWSDLERIQGVPVLTRSFDAGKATDETRLTAVREGPLPAAEFEVPKGFAQKRMDMPGGEP